MSIEAPNEREPFRRGLGLALIAGATLTAEVTLTRLFSAALFHHFAFVVVSTALFGTALGGLAVAGRGAGQDSDRTSGLASLGFAVLLPTSYALSQRCPLEPLDLFSDPTQPAWFAVVFLLLALPFAASGWAMAATLDRHATHAPRLYAADLAGASAGCFVALAALYFGPTGLYAASAAAVAAAAAFSTVRAAAIAAVGLTAAALMVPLPLRISASKITRTGEPFAQVLADPQRALRTHWNPLGRIDVVRVGRDGRRVILDAGVAAVRIPPPRARAVASDVTLPYELRPDARVLIIGAGAGWEVQEALQFNARTIDAVEINAHVAAEAPARLRDHPKVRWHITNGRAFLHQVDRHYDAIVLIHTISNAATAAGAMSLAEDYLLTVEAAQAMLHRLDNGGILLMTRPEAQLAALKSNFDAAGITAAQWMAWTETTNASGFYAAVMIRKGGGWTASERIAVTARLKERQLRLQAPTATIAPVASGPWRSELPADNQAAASRPSQVPRPEPSADNRSAAPQASQTPRPPPSTDDRPYFHRASRASGSAATAFSGQGRRARLALEDQSLAEASVYLVLAETTVMAIITLVLPVLFSRRRQRLDDVGWMAIYFGSLGLGFMLVEVVLVQSLSLMLGSPTLSFAVVFAGLLAGAAGGSRYAAAVALPYKEFLPSAVAVLAALMWIAVIPTVLGAPLPVRLALALLIVAVVGFALGMPFPQGLRALARHGSGTVASALAFNGVMSVAGTGAAILLSLHLGYTRTLFLAAAVYAVAGVAFVARFGWNRYG